jgi:hypothetical protein
MHRLVVLALPLLLLVAVPARAADRTFDPEAAAKTIAPFIDERTMVVAHVDLTRVDVDTIAAWAVKLTKVKPEAIANQQKFMADAVKMLTKGGAKDIYFVLRAPKGGDPNDLGGRDDVLFAVVPVEPGADAGKIGEAFTTIFKGDKNIGVDTINKSVVVGLAVTRQRLKTQKPVARPEIAKAFTALGDGVAHAVVFAGQEVRTEIEKELKELPAEIGGGPTKVLTQGGQWAAVKVEAPPKFKLTVVGQGTDKDAAKALQQLSERFLKQFCDNIEFRLTDKQFQRLVPQPADGNRITLTVDEPLLTELVPPFMQAVDLAAKRAASMNNMKQLNLAFINVTSNTTTGDLPPVAIFDKQNKPLLSWRVHLLPYIDQLELYKQFHLDEPWDTEHNKKLIAKMPRTYANPFNPKLAEQGKTTYLAPVHKNAMFTGDKTILHFPADIPDGTSNTILLVEVEDDAAVIWTKPDDLKLDLKDPLKGLGGKDRAYFLAAFCDGSVYQLPKKIDKEKLAAYFTRNGNEKVEGPYKEKLR